MKPSKRLAVVPYRIFEEYVTNDIVFQGFVWHGGESFSVVLPEVTVTADVKVDKGVKSLYQISPSIKYNMAAVPASAIPQDAIRVNMPRIPSLEEAGERSRRAPIKSDTPLPDPIKGTNRNGVENATHLVKKGETIDDLSKMYGVSINDLKDINNQRLPSEGQYYNVFPEVYFGIDWRERGYHNSNSGMGIIYDCETILEIAIDFLIGGDGTCGVRLQNMVITGKAREQVQNWDEVQLLVSDAKSELIKRGCNPGDVAETGRGKKIDALPIYVAKSALQNAKGLVGFHNDANTFWSPVHVLGSFALSMRVNADGQTATVAVYDSKTISSLSDNILGSDANNTNGRALESTYHRYVWTIRLK